MTNSMQSFSSKDWSDVKVKPKSIPKKSSNWPLRRIIVLFILLTILAISSWQLVKQYSAKTFPDMPAGKYWGLVSKELSHIKAGTRVFLERSDKSDIIYFTLIDSETSRSLEIPLDYSTLQDDGSFSAVSISLEGKQIKLFGERGRDHDYEGTIVDASTGHSSPWTLDSIFVRDVSVESEEKLKHLLLLNSETGLVKEQAKALSNELERSKRDALMITSYTAGEEEGSSLLKTEIEKIETEINNTRAKIKDLEEKAKNLQNQIELSKKISPRGRLVALTRETLERDRRWASSLQRNTQSKGGYLKRQYQEALQIRTLLDKISELEALLNENEGYMEDFSSAIQDGDDAYWLNYE